MIRLFCVLVIFLTYCCTTYAAFPVKAKKNTTIVNTVINERAITYPHDAAPEKVAKASPSVGDEIEEADLGLSTESILSLVLPLAALAFFIVYTPVTAPVVALICGVVGITSILLADNAISNDKPGKGLAIAGYVLGTVGAIVAAGIGFYYLMAAIFG